MNIEKGNRKDNILTHDQPEENEMTLKKETWIKMGIKKIIKKQKNVIS